MALLPLLKRCTVSSRAFSGRSGGGGGYAAKLIEHGWDSNFRLSGQEGSDDDDSGDWV